MKNVAAYDVEIRTSFRPAFMQLRNTLSAYGLTRSIDAVAATLHQGAAFEAGAMQTIMQFNLTRPPPTSNAAFTAAGLVAPTQAPAQPTPLFGAMMAMPPPQQQQPALMFYPTALAARPAGSVSSTPQERSSELKEEIMAELSAKISGEVAKLKEELKDELKTEITSEQNAYLNDEFLEEWENRTMAKLFPRLVDVLRDELKEMVAAAGMPPALKRQKKQKKEEEKELAAE